MRLRSLAFLSLAALPVLSACEGDPAEPGEEPHDPIIVDRYASIPPDVSKVTPDQDPTPPFLHSHEFQEPVPLPVISTAGAEDAPFIPADRQELYFFFAADVRQSPGEQIQDPANGIWVSRRVGGQWQEPALVWLQAPGELALNGCPFVGADELYFCTVREGFPGINWFRAQRVDGQWANWGIHAFDPALQVGELHIHENRLYYHSDRPGGEGLSDIWMATSVDGEPFGDPVNVWEVNTPEDDSRPYVSPDGTELWITRWYQGSPAIFRSLRHEGAWLEPELIMSQFAGEPTLDAEGNLYFVHHFYIDGVMREADIYVAYRK